MAKALTMPYGPYLAEALGMFTLTLAVALSLVSGAPELTPIVAALTLGLFVYTIGPVSGCHLNPAVTVGLWSVGRVKLREASLYVVVQCIGALLASGVAVWLSGVSPQPIVEDLMIVGVAELIGAAILVFGVAAVASAKVSPGASGVTVGGSLLLGIIIASTESSGLLNPAVALGVGSLSTMYVVGPLAGGIVGAWLYKWVSK